MVHFFEKTPSVSNLGDLLASPRHYFSFRRPVVGLSIIGGGAFLDFGMREAKACKFRSDRTVVWGIGQSVCWGEVPTYTEQFSYVRWGLRDRDLVDRAHFLPCASCLHEMLDRPIDGDETLLFLNADARITHPADLEKLKEISSRAGWSMMLNCVSERAFYSQWRKARNIVTNSYHGTYWSLLSGRRVVSIGYSSKFSSLLLGLGFQEQMLVKFDCGDHGALVEGITEVALAPKYLELANSGEVRNEYREINMAFAESLVATGLIESFKLRRRHLAKSWWRYHRARVRATFKRGRTNKHAK